MVRTGKLCRDLEWPSSQSWTCGDGGPPGLRSAAHQSDDQPQRLTLGEGCKNLPLRHDKL
jgi:hypothetical protein